MKAKKVAKNLKKYLENANFMNEVYKRARTPHDVDEFLGSTLAHIICTDGAQLQSPIRGIYTKEICSISKTLLTERVLEEAVMTHSFNGYNYEKVKKYGLGSDKIRDENIDRCYEIIEKNMGEAATSEFTAIQSNSANEIYMCSPGVKSFYYATSQSPERLYLGLLKQERGHALPVYIGETKEEYMLRVAYDKIDKCDCDNKDELRAAAKYLVDSFCTKRPKIAIFDAKSKDYELKVHHATIKNGKEKDLLQWIKENAKSPLDYFSVNGELIETNNLGNLVSYNSVIPPRDLAFVEVPDNFEIIQNLAVARRMKLGDEIDYYTGHPYVRKSEKQGPTIAQEIKYDENLGQKQNLSKNDNEMQ